MLVQEAPHPLPVSLIAIDLLLLLDTGALGDFIATTASQKGFSS